MHLLLLFPLLFWLSGSSAVIMCPEVRGPEQDSLTIQCRYDPGWESFVKYWCRGADFRNCTTLARTTGSQRRPKKGRVSISDNWQSLVFTVTMEKLRREDAGTYWCGIEKRASNHGVPVKVAIGPGSSAVITGPEEVGGPEQGSLTVQCCYDSEWKTYVKYWCRGADFRSCTILVRTTGSEREVKKDRVSIRDNQTSHTFTVTLEKLRRGDAGTYWCGIERTGADHAVLVKVAVGPATAVSTTTPTTTTFTVPVTTDVPTRSPTVSTLHPKGRGLFTELHVLLPLLSALLLLLLVAALLLVWRVVRRRKKAAGMPPEQVLQPLEDICYANLTLQQSGSTPSSTRKRPSAKHSSSALEGQASFPKEDISYAALSLDALDQDTTYVNTGDIVTHLPSRGHEELTEYSTIMKP